MPAILRRRPDAVYVVLGATHPNLVRDQGEAYRDSLMSRVRELGVEDHVVFLDQFVDRATLLDFISMCDVYVTPYLNEAQMTSGTLAYSFGLGKAVVSTPYWHAQELLADGRGILVPFGDAVAIGDEIAALLTDDGRRQAMRQRAYASSRSMTWERTAERYLAVFETARRGRVLTVVAGAAQARPLPQMSAPPEMQTGHFLRMCDDTGLFQHAVHSVPDRAHGYCVDDNARALLLACVLNSAGEQRLREALTARFAAFVQHAWNPDTRRFRNFMSFDRRWLEDAGSEDSHGRTLWALGECARSDVSPSRRHWAAALFAEALPVVESFGSPRAWAFTLLGLDAYCAVPVRRRRRSGCARCSPIGCSACCRRSRRPDWVWFEEGLSYDNARLRQALIVTGTATKIPGYVEAGLRSLRWLTASADHAGGLVPAGRLGQFRRQAQRAKGLRPAAARGDGDDLRLPCRLACRRRSAMAGRSGARLRLVPRPQRSLGAAGRSRDRQLPRRPASRPRKREPRRRIRRILSARPCRHSPACPHQRGSPETGAASGLARLSLRRSRTQRSRSPCRKPPS